MMTYSYPKPTEPLPYASITPTALYPLATPRNSGENGPPLPLDAARRITREGAENIIPGYIMSTHIFRASSPRTKCNVGPTPTFPITLPDRKEKVLASAKHLGSLRGPDIESIYEEGWPAPEDGLWMVVNRFLSTRLDPQRAAVAGGGGGITMTFMHANGFHKETWEEALRATVRQHPAFSDTVDEMWLFDSVNHGDSALINEGKLGDIFNWQDNARDLLTFLLFYLPEKAGSSMQLHLKPLSEALALQRRSKGFQYRRVIGVGHSLGGTSTCRAAIDSPNLFSDVILIDPIIYSPYLYNSIEEIAVPLSSTVGRRADFPNREVAYKEFLRIPFFSKWDRRVLKAYVDYAMVDEGSGGVRLKTHGFQEAAVFAERRIPMEVWELLPQLDHRIELRWIMSGKENNTSGGDNVTPHSVWRREATVWHREENSSNIRMRGSGHLITQTVPDDLGNEFGDYVLSRYATRTRTARL